MSLAFDHAKILNDALKHSFGPRGNHPPTTFQSGRSASRPEAGLEVGAPNSTPAISAQGSANTGLLADTGETAVGKGAAASLFTGPDEVTALDHWSDVRKRTSSSRDCGVRPGRRQSDAATRPDRGSYSQRCRSTSSSMVIPTCNRRRAPMPPECRSLPPART